jgi:hypothetical protein
LRLSDVGCPYTYLPYWVGPSVGRAAVGENNFFMLMLKGMNFSYLLLI